MAEEAQVLEEVEAVQAVYEEDCTVLDKFPPNIHVHIKPRSADRSSQQLSIASFDGTRIPLPHLT
ncbi:hypothetical protein L1049_007225 [Liquidambar formosana]|uniref:RWD domain-containing protein n=1 Tax=Liquidambar formosana TaxID=63359 RepID=A0AAP0RIG3_LIQFO